MARVNLETRALAEARFFKLMKLMRWRRRETLGCLCLLWHDSQERLVVEATKEQIVDWVDAKNATEGEKILDALIKAEYVDPVGDGSLFRIRGNNKHVTSHQKMRDGASKGGKASSEAKKNKELGQPRLEENSTPTQPPVQPNTMQYNSMQNNSTQSNATQDNAKQLKLNTSAEGCEQPSSARPPSAKSHGVEVELAGDSVVDEMLNSVSRETQKAWLKAFPGPDWIKQEVLRANVWMSANPQKRPKQLARFLSNWFNRAFESYRKGLPSRRMTNAEINAEAGKDLWKRNQEGKL